MCPVSAPATDPPKGVPVRLSVVVVGAPGTGPASSPEALFHPGDDEAGLAERVAA
jgi:hypothetical protein